MVVAAGAGCSDRAVDGAANDQVRQQLDDLGIDPSGELTYEHFAYFAEEVGARGMAAELDGDFAVDVREPADGYPEWTVVATQRASLTSDELDSLTRRLSDLAEEHGGEYDGWGVPLDPVDGRTDAG